MTVALAALLALVAGPATADAAKSKRKYPVVTSISPMDAKVGETISIRGRYFKRGKNKNAVVFKPDGKRAVFAKQTLGTARLIRVVVPAGLRAVLAENRPTRVRVRILSERFGKRFTSDAASPRITALPLPIDSDGDGVVENGPSSGSGTGTDTGSGSTPEAPQAEKPVCTGDEDGDWLPASLENAMGLDSCKADTDEDGVPDGYEYQSARDLNNDEYQETNSLPFPGTRPYPNPLDGSDAGTDYDGDGLTLNAEYRLQKRYGTPPAGLLPLDSYRLYYSDGEQYSLNRRKPGTDRREPSQPAASYTKANDFLDWASTNGYNPVLISKTGPYWYSDTRLPYDLTDTNLDQTPQASESSLADADRDGWISDDERDEDADGLSNFDELRSRMTSEYWAQCYAANKETPYPITYGGVDLTDPDTDGDGIRDGADDQDHDDLPNVMELSRYDASGGFADWHPVKGICDVFPGLMNGPDVDGDGGPDPVVRHAVSDYGRVNPFNPCLPFTWARACSDKFTFGTKHAPFDGSPWYSLQ